MASARALDVELASCASEEDQPQEPLVSAESFSRTRRRVAASAALMATALVALALATSAVSARRSLGAPAVAPQHVQHGSISLEEKVRGKKTSQDDEDKAVFKKCLCVFDIDRTLTGKQGWEDQCAKDTELGGVPDEAYGKGTLMVSELAQSVGATFCGECYHGVVTAGSASGPNSPERQRILNYLGGTARTRSDYWQDVQFKPETKVVTSLVTQASDGFKQESVKSMVQWWREKQSIDIQDEDVYFFDDIKENVLPFKGTGFNARQVSCGSRGPAEFPGQYDGKIGGCGGAFTEIEKIKGVHVCDE